MSERQDVEVQQPLGQRLLWLAREASGLTAMAAMAVLGIGIAVYLTVLHYAKIPPVCTTGGVINCGLVTSSAYSVVPGTSLPITIPGIVWFLVSGGLAVVGLRSVWRSEPEPARLRLAHVAWAAVGLLSALYLVYAEIVLLHRFCEWCTGVHVLILLTFLVALQRLQDAPRSAPVRRGYARPSARTSARMPASVSGTRGANGHRKQANAQAGKASRTQEATKHSSGGTRRGASARSRGR
jgi:uncharacterized membrane protein